MAHEQACSWTLALDRSRNPGYPTGSLGVRVANSDKFSPPRGRNRVDAAAPTPFLRLGGLLPNRMPRSRVVPSGTPWCATFELGALFESSPVWYLSDGAQPFELGGGCPSSWVSSSAQPLRVPSATPCRVLGSYSIELRNFAVSGFSGLESIFCGVVLSTTTPLSTKTISDTAAFANWSSCVTTSMVVW